MDIRQIKYFLELSKELHFWKTSQRMFITQSALSRQIKSLEEELGIQLFERSKRKVKLTEAGAFFRDKWEVLLEEIERVDLQAKKIHQGATGLLRIGHPGSIAYSFMPKLITKISETLPDLKMELIEPTDISFEQMLLNYQLDVAFRRDPAKNPALESSFLYSEAFALAVPINHPLNKKNFDSLQDIKDEKFILSSMGQHTSYNSSLRQMFKDYDFEPNIYIETDFSGMGLGLVSRGIGVTILPFSYSFSALPNVRFIPLPYEMNLYVSWRKNEHSPLLNNVLQAVIKTAEKYKEENLGEKA